MRASHRAIFLVVAVSVALVPHIASSQTVVNPSIVSFIPSPDHNATDTNGRPILGWYDFEIYEQGAAQPFLIFTLGKPDPGSDGYVTVDFSGMLASAPRNVLLEARVTAVGPGGSSRSAPSNLFIFDACTVTVSPGTFALPPEGSTGVVAVSAAGSCSWQATTRDAWISVTSGASGTGAGSVRFAAAANPTTVARSGTLRVNGQTVAIQQAGAWPPAAVYLRTPVNGARFIAPARFAITAAFAVPRSAQSSNRTRGGATSGGVLARLEVVTFFANGAPIGSASGSPFSVSWSAATPGTYVITAVATWDNGTQTTSPPATVTVRRLW